MNMKEGIHAIIQKINQDGEWHGRERYEQIRADIDETIERENEFYQEEMVKRREMFTKHMEHEYGRRLERMNSRLNREYLSYQHILIDEIFDLAVSRLRDASEEEFSALFLATTKELQGSFTLQLGALSKDKFDIKYVDRAMKNNNRLLIIMSNKTIPNRSGFLLKDDRVEYNCLFEDLIEDQKSEQAAAILKEVFIN